MAGHATPGRPIRMAAECGWPMARARNQAGRRAVIKSSLRRWLHWHPAKPDGQSPRPMFIHRHPWGTSAFAAARASTKGTQHKRVSRPGDRSSAANPARRAHVPPGLGLPTVRGRGGLCGTGVRPWPGRAGDPGQRDSRPRTRPKSPATRPGSMYSSTIGEIAGRSVTTIEGGGERAVASGPAGARGRAGQPVRLLHAGHSAASRGVAGRRAGSRRRADHRGAAAEYLPVRLLPPDIAGRAPGR